MSKILYTDDPQTKARIKADGLKQAKAAAWIMAALFICSAVAVISNLILSLLS